MNTLTAFATLLHKVHNIEAPKNVANEYVSPYMAYFPSPHVASYAAPLAKSYVPVVKNEEHKVEEESKDVSTFVSPYNAYFLTPSYAPSVKTLKKVVKKFIANHMDIFLSIYEV
ncbi:unnamed protein product [Lepeophtheirus salmonis]|uniref:(salmon louse) hypothetical protein n=1 Tax=Lepeophtheirus salmonis TaxID=72036 RepID=A0A7R8CMJ5_LEPSM|nr:unnamed protein product [Lepeophtheirus salmonis]CAF2866375.1 unnamed protein product [Lepeophtheirus salmonis]